jgi:UDPglucose 6-dehydrogenase
MKKSIIGFCGMTHLGISTAIGSIARDYETVCMDTNKKTIEDLNNCNLSINEPLLKEVLIKKNKFITFTDDFSLLKKCDIIYISQDIITNSNGESSLVEIKSLIKKVISYLRKEQILIILSQVPPGFTRVYLKKFKNTFYQVETLIFGQAFERTMYPERYIIGCENPENPLPVIFVDFLKSTNCPIIKMKYESAELTKISINMYLISSITIANKMSEICENLDADWEEIVPALKLDKRIGKHAYIKAQLGISGGNLERDISTAIKISKKNKINTKLFETFFKISNDRKDWVFKIITKEILKQNYFPRFAVLGLSYKKDTHSTKNAPSLVLLPKLKKHSVIAYDPVVDVKKIAPWCEKAKTPKEAIKNADVLIILTPWEEIVKLDMNWISRKMKNKYFIDPYNVFNKIQLENNGIKYFSIGKKLR